MGYKAASLQLVKSSSHNLRCQLRKALGENLLPQSLTQAQGSRISVLPRTATPHKGCPVGVTAAMPLAAAPRCGVAQVLPRPTPAALKAARACTASGCRARRCSARSCSVHSATCKHRSTVRQNAMWQQSRTVQGAPGQAGAAKARHARCPTHQARAASLYTWRTGRTSGCTCAIYMTLHLQGHHTASLVEPTASGPW